MLDFFRPINNDKSTKGSSALKGRKKPMNEHRPTSASSKEVSSCSSDKKRKKGVEEEEAKVVTNGVEGHKSSAAASSSSPPAKKRILPAESENEALTPATEESINKRGIGNFFKAISKKEFISESERRAQYQVMTVKALVHHSPPSRTTPEAVECSRGGGESKRRRTSGKRGQSKYVRRSEETDVIQVNPTYSIYDLSSFVPKSRSPPLFTPDDR